ncbi:hypothetical protein AMELA_G00150920 [Ameiurus melas]|uniref:Uncharacterized protein n=1 Tax=Ameiurus melas TaxID=219545 RepID=A0A7J6AI25_AMEME|nr:hypothetical protein AMELA_G00150920 [Ameiurus melas]
MIRAPKCSRNTSPVFRKRSKKRTSPSTMWSSWVRTKRNPAVDVTLNGRSSELLVEKSSWTAPTMSTSYVIDLRSRAFFGAERNCLKLNLLECYRTAQDDFCLFLLVGRESICGRCNKAV